MKLGLLADIHEHNRHLRMALHAFRHERVDQVVVLGDVIDRGNRIEESCRLLKEVAAIGVWGNHDFGLCYDPAEWARRKYSQAVLDFMASLQPSLEIEGCRFTHIEPWLDPYDVSDLWNLDMLPYTTERLARSFGAVQNRVMIMGHIHQYFAATPTGLLDWHGEQAIRLDAQTRYLIGLAALHDGKYAVLDTCTDQLIPLSYR